MPGKGSDGVLPLWPFAAPSRPATQSSCYTEFVLKNVTITVNEQAVRWARKKAAEENISLSKLVGRMLEDQMRRSDDYRKAYQKWKRINPIAGIEAAHRLSRDELHARR